MTPVYLLTFDPLNPGQERPACLMEKLNPVLGSWQQNAADFILSRPYTLGGGFAPAGKIMLSEIPTRTHSAQGVMPKTVSTLL